MEQSDTVFINCSYNIYTDRMDMRATKRDGTQTMLEPLDLEKFREFREEAQGWGIRFYDGFGKELGGD